MKVLTYDWWIAFLTVLGAESLDWDYFTRSEAEWELLAYIHQN